MTFSTPQTEKPIRRKKGRPSSTTSTTLEYHDVIVTKQDTELLSGPHWINDILISFVFEYYRQEIYKNQASSLAFVPPDFTQLIKLTCDADEARAFASTLNLERKNVIFLPINDNDLDEQGGTHWSLLVYFKDLDRFIHYDSQENSCNFESARIVASRLVPVLQIRDKAETTTRSNRRSSSQNQLISEYDDFPKQENSYDCGLYVIMAVTILAETHRQPDCGINVNDITPKSISVLRHQMHQTIAQKLREKNQNIDQSQDTNNQNTQLRT